MSVIKQKPATAVNVLSVDGHRASTIVRWAYMFAHDRMPTQKEIGRHMVAMLDRDDSMHDVLIEIMGQDGARSPDGDHSTCSGGAAFCKGRWLSIAREHLGDKKFDDCWLGQEMVLIVMFVGNHQVSIVTTTGEMLWPELAEYSESDNRGIIQAVRRARQNA